MGLSERYTVRKVATPALLDLLTQTTLGTNGARYKHLDTPTRILEADNPLFISLEKDGKVQGNLTFCNRETQWYLRYFAFANQKQASKNVNRMHKSNSKLKKEMASFFDEIFDGRFGTAPESFYAYIDPANERSKWMSEQFGFRTEAQLISQSFSRTKPKKQPQVRLVEDSALIEEVLKKIQETHAYFTTVHAQRGPFYGYFDSEGTLLGLTKITRVNWTIERLPGILGGFFKKLIPFTPGIRKIIKPKRHQFLVPESVWIEGNDPTILSALFEGILALEERNMLLWFIDRREPVWREAKPFMDWGLYHKMAPQQIVDVVVLRKNPLKLDELRSKPIFVAGWDVV